MCTPPAAEAGCRDVGCGRGRRYVDARALGVQVSLLLLTEVGVLAEWGADPLDNLLDVAEQAGHWALVSGDATTSTGFADGFILGVMATGGWPRR
jgi:hypothetical protein